MHYAQYSVQFYVRRGWGYTESKKDYIQSNLDMYSVQFNVQGGYTQSKLEIIFTCGGGYTKYRF